MWALVQGGMVCQLSTIDPAAFSHPEMPWIACPPQTSLGDLCEAGAFSKPALASAPPAARIVSSADFMALFTPAQTAALWSADPQLMVGAIRVMIQGTANLDSQDAVDLLALAVAKGALSEAEKARILAGTRPPPQPTGA